MIVIRYHMEGSIRTSVGFREHDLGQARLSTKFIIRLCFASKVCLGQASVSLGAPRMPTNTQHPVASTGIFQASQTHADPIPSHLKSTFTQLKKGFGSGAETQSLF